MFAADFRATAGKRINPSDNCRRQKQLTQTPPANLEAYQHNPKGRFYWNRRTPEWVRGHKIFAGYAN
ncbi:MAG: hypothetical protein U0Y68_16840 [Blastocatellia bacterium]